MCRKLEKCDPLMGSLSSKSNHTSKFYICRPCLLDMRSALAPHLSQRSAVDQYCGPNILEQLSAEKQWVGGGGCVLHSPLIANRD